MRVTPAKPQPPLGGATRGLVLTRKRKTRPSVFTAADFRVPSPTPSPREGWTTAGYDVADSHPHGPRWAPRWLAAPALPRTRGNRRLRRRALRRSAGCGDAYGEPPPRPENGKAPHCLQCGALLTLAAIYSRRAYRPTTIDALMFHFRVRNGTGWGHQAMTTRLRLLSFACRRPDCHPGCSVNLLSSGKLTSAWHNLVRF